MKLWHERSIEGAHLMNPAFCCAVLTSSIVGYTNIKPDGMSFPLTFIILPVVLHKETRDKLPRGLSSKFSVWIQENARARVQFYERVVSLKPYTREALTFGAINNWLSFQEQGSLLSLKTEKNIEKYIIQLKREAEKRHNNEAKECVEKALFVGKWFASAGPAHIIMTHWGIRP